MPAASTNLVRLVRRRTKIVATLGPASREQAVIEKLIRAGVDVFRLNLSHGEHDSHRMIYDRVRAVCADLAVPVAVLADLCGPKIRVGHFAGGCISLVAGQEITVSTRDVLGGAGLIPSQYAALAADVNPGDRILLDDGLIELRVLRIDGTEIACTVQSGGLLKDRKGMNLPGVAVSAPALTDKDQDDARFALDLGVDFLALSFVRHASDVVALKGLVSECRQTTPVIAKIEKPEALDSIESILDAADGVMVARGDLGVELEPEAVPIVQQELVIQARRRGKPVIVATQMLESMIANPRPTRAEVSDVSHAVFAGADAVMLSAETASGAYPVEAVEIMNRVARRVESWQWMDDFFRSITHDDPEARPPLPLRQALARSIAQLSRDLKVRAIVVRTVKGISASIVATTRPSAPVVALTTDPAVCRRLNLLWGVVPHLIESADFDQPQAATRRLVHEHGLASEGQYILLVDSFGRSEPTITVLPM